MSAPLFEHLSGFIAQNRISFAMPGHKNGRGLLGNLQSLDVTELSETENLHHGGPYVKEAQKLLSKLYGSDASYILTGGSTAAIQSMICAAMTPGKTLLSAADCHMSVINTCALTGIRLRLIPKETDSVFATPKATPSVSDYLTDDVGAVIITSPNYYGVCSDIKAIAEECHEKNIPLLVDEAHGAHFIASSSLPESALMYADAVCHSAHKTLNALTGAAYLHVRGNRINRKRLVAALSMFQSSSPSYVIASSADKAREELTRENGWDRTYDMCAAFRKKVTRIGIKVLDNDDMTRIVLNFSNFDTTGFDVQRALSERGIDVEMADLYNVVLIVTTSNTHCDIDALYSALSSLTADMPKAHKRPVIPPPPACGETLDPRKVFFSESADIPLSECVGHVSAATVVPYPPGIPVIYTGETITEEKLLYITALIGAGAEITGLSGDHIAVGKQA